MIYLIGSILIFIGIICFLLGQIKTLREIINELNYKLDQISDENLKLRSKYIQYNPLTSNLEEKQ